jgi:hypothetical protein
VHVQPLTCYSAATYAESSWGYLSGGEQLRPHVRGGEDLGPGETTGVGHKLALGAPIAAILMLG